MRITNIPLGPLDRGAETVEIYVSGEEAKELFHDLNRILSIFDGDDRDANDDRSYDRLSKFLEQLQKVTGV